MRYLLAALVVSLLTASLASPALADIGPGPSCTIDDRSDKRTECVACATTAECEALGSEWVYECTGAVGDIYCRPDPDYEGGCASSGGARKPVIFTGLLAIFGALLLRRSRRKAAS
ncbi:MAG: hypothetical protein P1V51_08130 [Deltaproteobacteria bacterium]|nr:hypothetical protein [Deltaproteobacteria bacterium]